jgi:hypothetical protein
VAIVVVRGIVVVVDIGCVGVVSEAEGRVAVVVVGGAVVASTIGFVAVVDGANETPLLVVLVLVVRPRVTDGDKIE